MPITKVLFGITTAGEKVFKFTLSNESGMQVDVLTYGATIQKLVVPRGEEKSVDIVLGFKALAQYEGAHPYIGCFVGRNANRLEGTLSIASKEYELNQNEDFKQLHGGVGGFHRKVWDAQVCGDVLTLSLHSADGEEGFPGNLNVKTTFELVDKRLEMTTTATTDQPTIVNLTRHEYFNLAQGESPHILDHKLQLEASRYTVLDKHQLPTGEIAEVAGTPFDFRKAKRVGDYEQGYDQNFVIDKSTEKLSLAAQLWSPDDRLKMSVFCTQPGLQFFSAKSIGAIDGKYGNIPAGSPGLCLEPQFFPNTPAHAHFPTTTLLPSEVYEEQLVYEFE